MSVFLIVNCSTGRVEPRQMTIERKGKPIAALVPVQRLEQMRRFARRHALEVLERQAGGTLSDEEAMNLALEARRWARRHSEQGGA
jgi:hypothetical protein